MNKKPQYSGIENQFPLLGGDPNCDYRFGIFTSEESPDCFFRLSFNSHSRLYASGIAPELTIVVDREGFDKNTGERFIEEKRYSFAGMQDYDEEKRSWFFPINDSQIQELADADCIKSIVLEKSHKSVIDLFISGQDVWVPFFRACVAECINEEKDSRELQDFCNQYYLTRRKLEIEALIDTRDIKASELACEIAKTGGDMEKILKLKL